MRMSLTIITENRDFLGFKTIGFATSLEIRGYGGPVDDGEK